MLNERVRARVRVSEREAECVIGEIVQFQHTIRLRYIKPTTNIHSTQARSYIYIYLYVHVSVLASGRSASAAIGRRKRAATLSQWCSIFRQNS